MNTKNDDSFTSHGVLLMLASMMLFSINTLLIRGVSQATPEANAWVATALRGIVGLVIVYALYGHGRGLDLQRIFKGKFVAIRGIVGALSIVAFYIAVVKIGAARAVVITLTYPIFASIIASFWLKEKISHAAKAWMLLGFCGLVIFLNDGSGFQFDSWYNIIALLGAVGAGYVVVIIRRLRNEETPATIYASQAFYNVIFVLPAAKSIPTLPISASSALILAAVMVSIGQLVMTKAFQTMSVSRGSSIQMISPIIIALGEYLFFSKTFHAWEICGGLLTLVATWKTVRSK